MESKDNRRVNRHRKGRAVGLEAREREREREREKKKKKKKKKLHIVEELQGREGYDY